MRTSELSNVISRLDQLPAFPLVLQKIQKLMRDQSVSIHQIGPVIAQDQALATKTIKLVNSAFYGFPKRITSINYAIVILGLNALNNLMIGIAIIKMFEKKEEKGFSHTAFWEHSFGCALLSRAIGKAIGYQDLEGCFTAGLLHDLGRLVLEQYLHDDFMTAYRYSIDEKVSLLKAENAIFRSDHAFIGGYLAMKWNLPSPIASAIAYHHKTRSIPYELSGYKKLIQIVAKADQLVIKEGIGDSGETFVVDDSIFTSLDLDPTIIEDIVSQVKLEVKATMKEWGIK